MLNPKTRKLALKSRDRRRLAADRDECKPSKQFFKIEYRYPWKLTRKLFFAKRRKTNEVTPHVCYDDSLPTKSNLIQQLLRGIPIDFHSSKLTSLALPSWLINSRMSVVPHLST